ncbi:hypothetical protein SKAU_G00274040 [Synaphobranchus kaupii]|uniref:HAT C-terminal dimerisation domain-containing protein n=1 Tax=Synaphobranchus kaupii TaxID=118154 RepID=A0A9Q1F128_SYNKA|nr:hypothetical protein SKAU_G00274040 [Synaphobranchus kaupii]
MVKKHKSGALKRKEKEQRKNTVASCIPLTNFFARSSSTQPSMSGQCLTPAANPTTSNTSENEEREHACSVQVAVHDDNDDDDHDDSDGADDATNRIQDLANFYAEDVSTSEQVLDEFLSFRAMCNELEIKFNTTEAVLPFMVCNDMDRAFPNISILYRIYATLPVTSANAERSFSRLKLIKNYLRACMKEGRLSNLTLLSIEKDIVIDKDKVAERFARMKERRMVLL